MMTALLTGIHVAACLIILSSAEPALNRMGGKTGLLPRLAVYLLAVGASAELWCVATGRQPNWSTVILLAGIAVMLLGRRLRRAKQDSYIPHL